MTGQLRRTTSVGPALRPARFVGIKGVLETTAVNRRCENQAASLADGIGEGGGENENNERAMVTEIAAPRCVAVTGTLEEMSTSKKDFSGGPWGHADPHLDGRRQENLVEGDPFRKSRYRIFEQDTSSHESRRYDASTNTAFAFLPESGEEEIADVIIFLRRRYLRLGEA
ncbi:uncharacterized protein ATNIH1004_006069 [Aspergillus tanneri]|uniref:Uncharacterized protein n=1 Tax=Aspergillus tanneri TaxID=1220188 RepID=A0A5M9MN70_9EURO|nr:uncharacterized protein ATNIH1004_006069 [Aspergillus tanneri]KAA8647376.1 hypothetical protein ATNIH1004_006069 [Aspergillus tanneri]